MTEDEIRELLRKHGYTLERIVHFKRFDRIRWYDSTLKVSLSLGKRIQDISKTDLEMYVK